MKNLIRKISLIMCVIMLTFAVSACGKSDNDSKKRMSRKLRTQQKMMQKTTQKTMQKIMTMLLLQEV